MRKAFPAIDSRRVDLGIQTDRGFPTGGEETKRRAKVAYRVLKGSPTDTAACAPHESFHVLRRQSMSGRMAGFVVKESEELGCRGQVGLDGRRRQSSYLFEIFAVVTQPALYEA
jgi:hypothetical protein